MEARISRFDIFSGEPDRDAIWLEAVEGLAHATKRKGEIAAQHPGRYFLLSLATHTLLDRSNTTLAAKPSPLTVEGAA